MDKNYTIVLSVIVLGLFFGLIQYFMVLQAELVNAVATGTPSPGHAWSEMECSSDTLCIDTVNNRLGIGTNTPSKPLEVDGDALFTGDVCNGAGACLSDMEDFIDSQPLVNSAHTQVNCIIAGGTVVDSDVSFPQCRFNASSCPSGWTKYKNFSTTSSNYWCGPGGGGCYDYCNNPQGCPAIHTSYHEWSNTTTESCVGWGSTTPGCTANPGCCPVICVCPSVTQIGCY
jgi:hypothetical protein